VGNRHISGISIRRKMSVSLSSGRVAAMDLPTTLLKARKNA